MNDSAQSRSDAEYSQTEAGILAAARDMFMEKGYSAATTREIAKRAGVNEVTVFRCFESKEKLFQAAYEHFFFKPDLTLLESFRPADMREYLFETGRFFHTMFVRNINVILIGIKDHPVFQTKSVIDIYLYELYLILIKQVMELKGCEKQEAEAFSFTFLSSLFGLFTNLYVFDTFKTSLTFEQCLNRLVDAFA